MDLNTMSYVLAVADAGNFSLAAQNCHVGQPALSQQIARLEKELGVTLFTRSSKGAVPTQAGREFVARAREILRAAQALHADDQPRLLGRGGVLAPEHAHEPGDAGPAARDAALQPVHAAQPRPFQQRGGVLALTQRAVFLLANAQAQHQPRLGGVAPLPLAVRGILLKHPRHLHLA